jgi:antitoxin component of MazEF toxin-antitoxin module
MFLDKRTLIKIGSQGPSLGIIIPHQWIEYYQLKQGDKLTLIGGNDFIKIYREKEKIPIVKN